MILNLIIFILYIFCFFISLLGYGLIVNRFFNFSLYTDNSNISLGELGFLSLVILLPISVLLNFIFPINTFISLSIFSIGLIFFFYRIKLKENYKKILYLLLFLLLILPYFVLITHHDDFYYYHLPYLNIIKESKIIFGLANLNNILSYPQNLWFNIFALFRLPIIEYNGLQVINGIFTFLFVVLCFEFFLNSKLIIIKIISFCFIVFTLAIFSRLKDHGAEIVPQLITLVIFLYSFILLFDIDSNKKNIIFKILILFTISILLRLSSIIIFPFLLFIILVNFKIFFDVLKKFKFWTLIFILISTVLAKNIINSGCLVYPLSFTCFKQSQISWSIDKSIPKINENVILSFTRGWMIYAKERNKNSNKFIFNPDEDTLTHKEFLQKGIIFWIKYWLKDPDIKRILNIFLIGTFIILTIIISNLKNLNIKLIDKRSYFKPFTLLILITPIMFWLLLSTPSTRYGGYSIFIGIVSFIVAIFSDFLFNNKLNLKNSFVVLFCISAVFFTYKNINRIIIKNIIEPWPEKQFLVKNVDYEVIKINNFNVNVRLPTNKLLMGKLEDKNNYILHCGNIKPLCTPIKKTQCIHSILKKYSYLIIKGNKKKCLELHKNHALY